MGSHNISTVDEIAKAYTGYTTSDIRRHLMSESHQADGDLIDEVIRTAKHAEQQLHDAITIANDRLDTASRNLRHGRVGAILHGVDLDAAAAKHDQAMALLRAALRYAATILPTP